MTSNGHNGKDGHAIPARGNTGEVTQEEHDAHAQAVHDTYERGRLRRELQANMDQEVERQLQPLTEGWTLTPLSSEVIATSLERLARKVRSGE